MMNVNDLIKKQSTIDPDDYRAERVEEIKKEHKEMMEHIPAMVTGAMIERIEDREGLESLLSALMAFRKDDSLPLQQWIETSIEETARSNAWISLVIEEVEARTAKESNNAFHARMNKVGR